MHILILKPTLRSLSFAVLTDTADEPAVESTLQWAQFDQSTALVYDAVLQHVQETLRSADLPLPDAIGIRALFGGEPFPAPTFVSQQVLQQLGALAHQAPLHVPRLVELIQAAQRVFVATPIVLAFETSFFVDLPQRERWYGLDPQWMQSQALRRFGYHGIFHDAAVRHVASQLRVTLPRVLSVCLEPRPELAACQGRRPVMVTGGNTPIEGLPGETTCGDVDPSVVLKLAHDTRWGPEETSRVLSCESGLLGLTGRATTISEVLADADNPAPLARDLLRNCLLRACGAGIAALGGLDAIVYSGRHAASGPTLHTWLDDHLARAIGRSTPYAVLGRTLCQLVGDIVRVETLGQERQTAGAGPG